MKISWFTETDNGSFAVNEDSVMVGVIPDGVCITLADGLGGNGYGDRASKIASDASLQELEKGGSLDEAFLASQRTVREEQRRMGISGSMFSTLCLLRIVGDRAEIGHVGDSRIYLFRDGKMEWRTHDHSVPQMLAEAGEIRENEIRFHPDRNRVLHVIGTDWEEGEYELHKPVSLSRGGIFRKCSSYAFLLCTDGWWELLDDRQMERLLNEARTPEEWLEQMKVCIREAGVGMEMDNYTAAAVFVD